jgi:hypothetical protein
MKFTQNVSGHFRLIYKFEIDGVGCSSGAVSWITQLVVHSDFRSHGVASKLCQMAWDVSAVDGCGIVTSHPYAIRALEKATRRSCRPGMIHYAKSLVAASRIPYLQGKPIRCNHAGSSMCQIDTGFFVDHTDVDELIPSQPQGVDTTCQQTHTRPVMTKRGTESLQKLSSCL